jgi:MFS family permease
LTPIYLIFALAVLNFATTQASRVLLSLYALDFGAAPLTVGAISATYSAFPMLLAWMAGRIADRHGSRWPLVLGALVCGCGMLVPYLAPGLPALFVAAALNGLSFTFYTVALQNLVGIMGDAQGRARRYSNYAMVVSSASFLGPLISGFSIDHLGFATTCLLVALLGLVPLALLASWGGMLPGGRPAAGPAESVRGILADRAVRRILVTSSLVVSGSDIFQFYLPIYGHGIGLSASAIGIVLAMFAAASVVVRLVIPRLLARLSPEQVLCYAFFIGATSFFLLPFFDNALTLSLISFVIGLGLGAGAPITLMLTYSQSPEGRSGEALGLRMTANHLARVIGPLVFGSIGSAFGLFAVFWINGAMMVSGGLLSGRGAVPPRTEFPASAASEAHRPPGDR